MLTHTGRADPYWPSQAVVLIHADPYWPLQAAVHAALRCNSSSGRTHRRSSARKIPLWWPPLLKGKAVPIVAQWRHSDAIGVCGVAGVWRHSDVIVTSIGVCAHARQAGCCFLLPVACFLLPVACFLFPVFCCCAHFFVYIRCCYVTHTCAGRAHATTAPLSLSPPLTANVTGTAGILLTATATAVFSTHRCCTVMCSM